MRKTTGNAKSRKASKRRTVAYWLAMSAMGTAVVSSGGRITVSAHAAARMAWSESATATQTQAPVHRFDIPAGPLDDAIEAFERTTSLEVEFARAGLGDIPSPGVQGDYTVNDALRRMLA